MSQADAFERQMLDLINEERTTRGLDPLQLELRLNDSAEDHSEWMLQQDVFSHTGAGGSSAGERMADAGFQFSGGYSWAENIAWQSERGSSGLSDDVAGLHESLMNSPGHRANILSPSAEVVGIGVEQGSFNGWDAVMVTQNFASTGAPVQLDTGGSGSGGNSSGSAAAQPTSGNDVLELDTAGNLRGLKGNDRLTGSGAADSLSGNGGRDTLRGRAGEDELQGGRHRDELWGGRGDDTLDGGNGNDMLTGGGGGDLFVFSSGDDTVTDFNPRTAGEQIDLAAADGISGFADLVANHSRQTSAGLEISDVNGNSLLLPGIAATDLQANDFLF
ncbi:CAP domain-containing protein [Cribrihabitans neustonicus]|uniref:CAP domain-containing protein n=1 Tax=Cribrihabitans neustonicus TaxID=1429085 RepID=UPI003B5A6E2D